MGKPNGFIEYRRELPSKRPVEERTKDYGEIYVPFPPAKVHQQAARCMDCGVPTCMAGCPLGNRIPDWNDLVYRRQWREALDQLHATNNFPEFTGRLCPAPCEEACVLSINDQPVTIEQIEREIIEYAFAHGWIQPAPPRRRTGKEVAVIGSGPAGLACGQQLNRAGHQVTILEQADRIGGLLRYGIPDFKMEKAIIDRRLSVLRAEGIRLITKVRVGQDLNADDLKNFDAVVLCTGAQQPRDLPLAGRELDGIHYAMDFLSQQNRVVAGRDHTGPDAPRIHAHGKHVIIIGGGDTGSDCIGTCNRQGARSIVNFQYTPPPPEERPPHQPWPFWPMRLRTSPSHEEGCERKWGLLTKRFEGRGGRVEKLITVEVDIQQDAAGNRRMVERPATEREWPADLVLLAIGYSGPHTDDIIARCGLELSPKGAVKTDAQFMTSAPAFFAAGDARRGQSLIVWAIAEGREAARAVDLYLMGSSDLPTKGCCDLPNP